MPRGRHQIVRSGPRRSTEWLASADSTDMQSLANGGTILDQTFTFLEPATIVRTRGRLYVASDQTAASEFPFGALGMLVASTPAATVGVGSLPTPITDEGSDLWFLHESWMASILRADGSGIMQGVTVFDFDSKAMRKVEEGSTACVLLENASATDTVQFAIKFRMLVKLHG